MVMRLARVFFLLSAALVVISSRACLAWNLTADQKAFIDRWLERNELNRYGDPKDTVYPGGAPLFDEATGQTIDRYDYIFSRHPELVRLLGLKAYDPQVAEHLRRLETDPEMAR